jgi:hypothetical protein
MGPNWVFHRREYRFISVERKKRMEEAHKEWERSHIEIEWDHEDERLE